MDSNPHMADDSDMDHWKVILRADRRAKMTVYFSKGFGHHGEQPELSEILSCLASDASSFEGASSFEDWARDFGFDADSRKAEKTYKAVERSSQRLRSVLGAEAYGVLLYHTDRE